MSSKKPSLEQLQTAYSAVKALQKYLQPFAMWDYAQPDYANTVDIPVDENDVNDVFIGRANLVHFMTISGASKKDIDTVMQLFQLSGHLNSLMYQVTDSLEQRLFDLANYKKVLRPNAPFIPESGYNVALAPAGGLKIKLSDPDEVKLFI